MPERPIAIFDSGVGGLTVVRAITRALPSENIIYFGDTARVPYGIKSGDTIRRYATEDVHFLMRFDPKLVVVACNTASAAALDHLKSILAVPVIGVVEPGALAAVSASKSLKVAVIATEATVESSAYERAITALRPDCLVVQKACPLFVPMVEEGRVSGEVAEMVACDYLSGLAPLGVDTLVLGCTHYPPLKGVIEKTVGPAVSIVDSATETARAVKALLEEKSLASATPGGRVEFFASDNPERFRRLAAIFLGPTSCSVTLVEPEDFFESS